MAIDPELSERLSVVCAIDNMLGVVVIQQVLDGPQYHPQVLNVTLPLYFEVVIFRTPGIQSTKPHAISGAISKTSEREHAVIKATILVDESYISKARLLRVDRYQIPLAELGMVSVLFPDK
jgi:hypothetical protein